VVASLEFTMKSILLIEDDPLLGAMIREMLEGVEYRVTWLRSGVPVRRIVAQEPLPDLILTDIVMPDMDGLETIQFLRDTCPNVLLVAMSAESGAGYLKLATRMGAMAVLHKPFTQKVLLETIAGLLAGRKDAENPE
jgi:two-component system, cell cycle sensor histidine kinase and response regulator CckA